MIEIYKYKSINLILKENQLIYDKIISVNI